MEQQRQKVLAELQEKEMQAKELDEEKAKLAKTTASLKEDIDVSVHGRCVPGGRCQLGGVGGERCVRWEVWEVCEVGGV